MQIGQHLMIGIAGTKITSALRKFIRASGVGGVIFYEKNCENLGQVSDFISALQDAVETPLIIGVDQEGGRVARLPKPFPELPPMATVGEAKDGVKTAGEVGELLGKEISALGFNIDFAPVLDIATNPSNPIIGDRAFSSDADLVARLGVEFIRGLESTGVAACGKHFPGHGDTDVDSHLDLPVLRHDRRRFDSCEFVPFRAAIKAGVSSMMIAHILAPALDPSVPASISHAIITGILRREMGYEGVVFSDDLMMKGIAGRFPPDESTWRAIAAGTDIAMVCCEDMAIQKKALDGLKRAVDDGRVSAESISESLSRVSSFKERFCNNIIG